MVKLIGDEARLRDFFVVPALQVLHVRFKEMT